MDLKHIMAHLKNETVDCADRRCFVSIVWQYICYKYEGDFCNWPCDTADCEEIMETALPCPMAQCMPLPSPTPGPTPPPHPSPSDSGLVAIVAIVLGVLGLVLVTFIATGGAIIIWRR